MNDSDLPHLVAGGAVFLRASHVQRTNSADEKLLAENPE